MRRLLGDCRIYALAVVIIVTAASCVTDAPLARPELDAPQTVTMLQFAALNRYYAAEEAGYDKGSVSDERLRSAFRNFYNTSPDLASRYGWAGKSR
jgi:hypothetical protein